MKLRNKETGELIGSYFSTKKEAERAVEKLKAWKLLKDKGFEFNGVDYEISHSVIPQITIKAEITRAKNYDEECELANVVNFLFGGEE